MAQSALGISQALGSTWKCCPFFLKGSLKQSVLLSSGVVTTSGKRISHERWFLISCWMSVRARVSALKQHPPLHAGSIFGALESFSRAWLKQSARKQSRETICSDINFTFLNSGATEALECTQVTESMKAKDYTSLLKNVSIFSSSVIYLGLKISCLVLGRCWRTSLYLCLKQQSIPKTTKNCTYSSNT